MKFINWFIRELIRSFLVFLIASYAVFVLVLEITPGHKLEEYGITYHKWDIAGFLQWFSQAVFEFDLGHSIMQNRTVMDLISNNFETTLIIVFLSIIFSLAIAVPVGLFSSLTARKERRIISDFTTYIISSMPVFLIAILCRPFWVEHFSVLDWGNIFEWRTDASLFTVAGYFIIPSLILALGDGALIEMVKQVKNDIQKTARENYVKLSILYNQRAMKYLGPSVLISVFQMVSSRIAMFLGGAIIIEYVFFSRGIGLLVLDALETKDIPVVLGVGLAFTAITLFTSLMSKVLIYVFNPRMRS